MTRRYNLLVTTTQSRSILKYNSKNLDFYNLDEIYRELNFLEDYFREPTDEEGNYTLDNDSLPKGYSCEAKGDFLGLIITVAPD